MPDSSAAMSVSSLTITHSGKSQVISVRLRQGFQEVSERQQFGTQREP